MNVLLSSIDHIKYVVNDPHLKIDDPYILNEWHVPVTTRDPVPSLINSYAS